MQNQILFLKGKYNMKDKSNKNDYLKDSYDTEILNAASMCEFTGAIPAIPESEEEEKSYSEVLDYTPKSIPSGKNKNTEKR